MSTPPLLKSEFCMSCAWRGIVVLIGPISYSLRARRALVIAASLVSAWTMSFPIMES